MPGRFRCFWFSKLMRVEPGSARRNLWYAAYNPVLKSPRYWGIALATQVAAQIAVVVPVQRLARRVGVSGQAVGFGLSGIVAALAVLVVIWLVRRRIRHGLRQGLARRGLPTCLACGYDLTGNVSGVCPECGTENEPP